MANRYRSLPEEEIQDYLAQAQQGLAGVNPAAQTLARSGSPVGQAMVEDQMRQNEINRQAVADEAERARKEAEKQAEQQAKDAAKQAKADAARNVRSWKALGAETTTDIETGKRTVATHPDGGVKFVPGPIEGAPMVEQKTVNQATRDTAGNVRALPASNPMIPGDGAIGTMGGTDQTKLMQPVRSDRGVPSLAEPESKTDKKTGIQTISEVDPATGRTVQKAVGVDTKVKDQADWAADIKLRGQEIDLRETQLKQARMKFQPNWEPVAKEFNDLSKKLASYPATFRRNDNGKWEKIDPKTDSAIPYDPRELAVWQKQKEDLQNRHNEAKAKFDKLNPYAENLNRAEKEAAEAKAKLEEDRILAASGLPRTDTLRELLAEAAPEEQAPKGPMGPPKPEGIEQPSGVTVDEGNRAMLKDLGIKEPTPELLQKLEQEDAAMSGRPPQPTPSVALTFKTYLAQADAAAARVQRDLSLGKIDGPQADQKLQFIAEWKGQTIAQAQAQAAAELDSKGMEIAAGFLGEGTNAARIAGVEPGTLEGMKKGINEQAEVDDGVASSLREAGGDIDKAIAITKQRAKSSAQRGMMSGMVPMPQVGGGTAAAQEQAKFIGAQNKLVEMKAAMDKAGIDPKDRPRIIEDTAKLTAWTENDTDNIRKLSSGELVFNPSRLFGQREAFIKEISGYDATPEAKRSAIRRFDAMRKDAAEKVHESIMKGERSKQDMLSMAGEMGQNEATRLRTNYEMHVAEQAKKGITDKVALIDGYMAKQKDRWMITKIHDAVTTGIASGAYGMQGTLTGTAAGLAGLFQMDGTAGALGARKMEIQGTADQVMAAGRMRGLTGGYGVTMDISNTVTQMTPMFVGGFAAKGLQGMAQAATAGASVYGWAGMQGYEQSVSTALSQAEQAKGGPLNEQEIAGVLGSVKTQAAGFLNAAQTVILAATLGKGVERAALGKPGSFDSMTVRSFITGGGMQALRSGTLRKEIKAMAGNILEDASDEAVEEFLNQFAQKVIEAGTLGTDFKVGDVLAESFYGGALGAVAGGGIPQVRAAETKPQMHKRMVQTLVDQTLRNPDPEMVATAMMTIDPQAAKASPDELKQARQLVAPPAESVKAIEERRAAYDEAIKAKDFKGAAAIDQGIQQIFTKAQSDASKDAADAVILTRELAEMERQASEATWQADEALTAAKMSGDKQAIAQAEAALEQTVKTNPKVSLVRAAVKLATGYGPEALTDAELRSVGYKPGENGGWVPMSPKELEAEGLTKPLIRAAADGTAVLLDEAVQAVAQTSDRAISRIKLSEQEAMEAAQARFDAAEAAKQSPAAEAGAPTDSLPDGQGTASQGAVPATSPPTQANEPNPQGQNQAAETPAQSAPANAQAPGGTGGSGSAATSATAAQAGSARTALASTSEAALYEAMRQQDPSMPDIPTVVSAAIQGGAPVSASMATQAAKAGINLPSTYARQGGLWVPSQKAPSVDASAQARTVAETVKANVEKAMPALKGRIEIVEEGEDGGGADLVIESGVIRLKLPAIQRAIKNFGSLEEAIASLENVVARHEAVHVVQTEALRAMWEAAGRIGSFMGFYQSFYEGLALDLLTPGAIKAARRIYGQNKKTGEWYFDNIPTEWQQAAEFVRMLVEAKLDGDTSKFSELFRAVKSRGAKSKLAKLIQKAIDILRKMKLSGAAKAHVDQLVELHRELTATTDTATDEKTPEVPENPANAGKSKDATTDKATDKTGLRIEITGEIPAIPASEPRAADGKFSKGTTVRSDIYKGEGDIILTSDARKGPNGVEYDAYFSGTGRVGTIQERHVTSTVKAPAISDADASNPIRVTGLAIKAALEKFPRLGGKLRAELEAAADEVTDALEELPAEERQAAAEQAIADRINLIADREAERTGKAREEVIEGFRAVAGKRASKQAAGIERSVIGSEAPEIPTGKQEKRDTPNSEMTVDVTSTYLDLSQLVGSSDPLFPGAALQPRNRASQASANQREEMVQNIRDKDDQHRRYIEGATTDSGRIVIAPLFAADGTHMTNEAGKPLFYVISGNGRRNALQEAAARKVAGKIEKGFRASAAEEGIDVEGMTLPVPVSIFVPKSAKEAIDLAEYSNRDAQLSVSNTEQANRDAASVEKAGILKLWEPDASGDPGAASNRDFVRAFSRAVGDEGIVDARGNLTEEGGKRIERAMVAMLLGPEQAPLLDILFNQSGTYGLRAILGGIASETGSLLKVAAEKPDFDLSPVLADALRTAVQAKAALVAGEIRDVGEFFDQGNLFESTDNTTPERQLARALVESRSRKAVRDILGAYRRGADAVDTSTMSMFAEAETSREDLIRAALDARPVDQVIAEVAAEFGQNADLPAKLRAVVAGIKKLPIDQRKAMNAAIGAEVERLRDGVVSAPEWQRINPDALSPMESMYQRFLDSHSAETIASGFNRLLSRPAQAALASSPGPDSDPGLIEASENDFYTFPEEFQSYGRPRSSMPQIKMPDRAEFVRFLGSRGVSASEEEVDPSILKPTQSEYSRNKAVRAKGLPENRRILISSDNYLIDGHHQWLAQRDRDTVPVIRIGLPVSEAIQVMREFPKVNRSAGMEVALEEAQREFDALLEQYRKEKPAGEELDVPAMLKALADVHGRDLVQSVMRDVAARRKSHELHKESFDNIIKSIARKHKAKPMLAGLKGIPRSVQKVISDYDGDAQALMDVLRGSIVAKTIADIEAIVSSIRSEFPSVVKFKDRFSNPLPTGYMDIMMTVEIAPGVHAEIQVHIPEMIQAKEVGHVYYDEQRVLPPDDPKVSELDGIMQRLYTAALRLSMLRATIESNSEALMGSALVSKLRSVLSENVPFLPPYQFSGSLAPGNQAAGAKSTSKNLVPEGKSDAFITSPDTNSGGSDQDISGSILGSSPAPELDLFGGIEAQITGPRAKVKKNALETLRKAPDKAKPNVAKAIAKAEGLADLDLFAGASIRSLDAKPKKGESAPDGSAPRQSGNPLDPQLYGGQPAQGARGAGTVGANQDLFDWSGRPGAKAGGTTRQPTASDVQGPDAGIRGSGDGSAATNPDLGGRGSGPGRPAESGEGRGSDSGNAGRDGGKRSLTQRPRPEPGTPARNFEITPSTVLAEGGSVTRIRNNVAAIDLLRTLEREDRNATPEEKAVLAKFVGWGGLPQVFDEEMARKVESGEAATRRQTADSYERYGSQYAEMRANYREQADRIDKWDEKWGDHYRKLRELLTPEEWESARESVINAHYTSPTVISGMWDAVRRMGFKGGNVLEPAGGIGHFYGLMPQDMMDSSRLFGIELDSVSGRIMGKLYPEAEMEITGFQDSTLPDNSQDLVISNVPFANINVSDEWLNNQADAPAFNLHNYFFERALRKTRPGGLVAFITTANTMDSQIAQRKWLAERSDFMGAIRLPNNAFKGNANTEVVTDIIFLRKPDGSANPMASEQWTSTEDVQLDNGEAIDINEYFARHPEMILGRLANDGSMYGGKKEMTVHGTGDLKTQLAAAIANLPENVTGDSAAVDIERESNLAATAKDGAFIEENGKVRIKGDPDPVPTKELGRVRSFIKLRDTLNELYRLEADPDATDSQIAAQRAALNRAYDGHKTVFGSLHERNNKKTLETDPDFYRTLGLEVPMEKKALRKQEYRKADVFSKRILSPRVPPKSADTVDEAIIHSFRWKGRLDAGYVGKLLGIPLEAAEARLLETASAFRDPASGRIEHATNYLAGNVRRKLRDAQQAAANDPAYQRNVEALERVMPASVPWSDIHFKMGSAWIPADVYERFLAEKLFSGRRNARVLYHKGVGDLIGDSFEVQQGVTGYANSVDVQWGTPRLSATQIVEYVLNQKDPRVYDTVDKKRVYNQGESDKARAAAERMTEAFLEWVSASPELQTDLHRIYNESFNSHVVPQYDGSFMQLPWVASDFDLYPDKKHVVWRALQEGTLLVAHGVGGGKTIIGTAIAMESRRLGLAKKPLIVVHNATLEQFATTISTMAPTARVLVARKEDLAGPKRKEFMGRVRSGDWDAVVMAHSTYDLIPDDPAWEKKQADDLVKELEDAIREQDVDPDADLKKIKDPSVKELVKMRRRLKDRIANLQTRRTDDVLTFQELGIDALIVDEVHRYKKLPFVTRQSNIAGIDTGFSKRGSAMQLRAKWVQAINQGRGVFTMTGTPVTNTVGEAWNMVRLVRPDLLKEFGVKTFDRFVSVFGNITQGGELRPNGSWKAVTRLSKFTNIPEWNRFWGLAADVKMGEDMQVKGRPKIKGGKAALTVVERTPGVAAVIGEISRVIDSYDNMTGREKAENRHIPLLTYAAARMAAIDIRLINPDAADEPTSKVNTALKNVMRLYRDTTEQKGTQVLFADSYRPLKTTKLDLTAAEFDMADDSEASGTTDGEEEGFNLYHDIREKLVAAGVPRSEIAIITEAKNDKQREAIFAKVNSGEVRIILGSTETLGTGVNMQQRMIAAHHLDVPWTPAGLEQRDGRVYRQGNMWAELGREIEIMRYGMKDTLDAALWQKLETKERFIKQAVSGKINERVIEDDDGLLNYMEQKAALSGPDGMLKFTLDEKVRGLKNEWRAHRNRQFDLQRTGDLAARIIRDIDDALPDARRVAKVAEPLANVDPMEVEWTVEGGEELKGEDAREAIDKAIKERRKKAGASVNPENLPSLRNPLHLTANGVPVLFQVTSINEDIAHANNPDLRWQFTWRPALETAATSYGKSSPHPRSLMGETAALATALSTKPAGLEARRAQAESDIEMVAKEGQKPFGKAVDFAQALLDQTKTYKRMGIARPEANDVYQAALGSDWENLLKAAEEPDTKVTARAIRESLRAETPTTYPGRGLAPEMQTLGSAPFSITPFENTAEPDLRPVTNRQEAEALYADGRTLYGVDEMEEGTSPITSLEMLRSYPPDAIYFDAAEDLPTLGSSPSSDSAFRQAATLSEARSMAAAFAGKPIANKDDGLIATVSRNALGKMLSESAVRKSESESAHAYAVANLDRLFEEAVRTHSGPDEKGSVNIAAMHRYYSPFLSGKELLLAKITVKEFARKADGNRLYTVEALDMVKPAGNWVPSISEDRRNYTPQAGFEEKLQAKIDEIKRNPSTLGSSPGPESAAVEQALAQMPPIYRDVFEAVEAGATVPEVLERFGDKVKTQRAVENILNQVRSRIQTAIKAAGDSGLAPEMQDGQIAGGGRPDLALGGNPAVAAVDQIRNQSGIPDQRKWDEVNAKARERLAADYAGEYEAMLAKARAQEQMSDEDVAVTKMIIARETISGNIDSAADRIKLGMLIHGYRDVGTETARALAIRRDPHMSPAERHAQFIAEALFTPDPETRARMRKRPESAESILQRWMARVDSIEAELLAQGIDIRQALADFRNSQEKQRESEAESPETTAIIETAIRKLNRREKAVIEAIRGGALISKAAFITGLSTDEVKAIYTRFMGDIRASMQEAAKRYLAGALGSSPMDAMGSILTDLGLPPLEMIDDTAAGFVDRRNEKPRKPRKPRAPKDKGAKPAPKAPPAPKVPGITPEQQAWLDEAWQRFLDSPLPDWRAFWQSEMGRVSWTAEEKADFERRTRGDATRGTMGWEAGGDLFNTERTRWNEQQKEDWEEKTTGTFDVHDPVAVKRVMDAFAVARGSKVDALMDFWRMSILTGPQTHIVNTGSNIINAAYNLLPRRGLEAVINAVLGTVGLGSDKSATFGEFAPMAKNLRQAASLAARNALRSWASESRVFEHYASAEALQLGFTGVGAEYIPPALGGKFGKVMRSLSFRAMTAADEFIKSFVGQLEVAAQAHRMAKVEEKLSGDAYSRRIDELMQPGSEAWIRTIDITKHVTFQDEVRGSDPKMIRRLDQLAELAKEGRAKPWIGRPLTFFLPFIDTPLNIFKQAVEISPLGAVLAITDGARALRRRVFSGDLTKQEAAEEAAELYDRARLVQDLTNQTIGLMLWFALEGLVGGDDDELPVITGTVPYKTTARGERDNAYAVMPPQTIRIGNVQFSYARIEPFATVLASMVDLKVSMLRQGGFKPGVASEWLGRFKDQAKDKTFLQGVSNLLNAVEDPDRFAERLAGNIITGFVPNIIRQPVREMDGTLRDQNPRAEDGFFTAMAKRVGYSLVPQQAPARYDVWGNEIKTNRGEQIGGNRVTDALVRALDPTNMQVNPSADPIDAWIFRYNLETADRSDRIQITPIPDKITGKIPGEKKPRQIPLTAEEQAEANRNAGRAAREMLGSGWEKKPLTSDLAEQIKDVVSKAQKIERERLRQMKLSQIQASE